MAHEDLLCHVSLKVDIELDNLLAHIIWSKDARARVKVSCRTLIARVLIVASSALFLGLEHLLICALELLVPIYVYSVLKDVSEHRDVCTIGLLVSEEVAA